MIYEIYCDRDIGKLYGRLTLQKVVGKKATKIFERLPISSGQYGYLGGGNQDWVIGKGAIPMGTHWISTKRERLVSAEPYGTPFYVISTEKGKRWLKGPNGIWRLDCGLHLNNRIPGSAGCIVLECDTSSRMAKALAFFDFLDSLYAMGIEYIQVKVI
jgi:hypothetical protein